MGIIGAYLRSFNTKRQDPYPIEILKRVEKPTTVIREEEIQRVDERESGFNRALGGDFGPQLSKERHRFVSTNTPFHRLVQRTMRNIPPARPFAVWADDLFGYGQPKLENKWWLDLEEVDGKMTVPSHAGHLFDGRMFMTS